MKMMGIGFSLDHLKHTTAKPRFTALTMASTDSPTHPRLYPSSHHETVPEGFYLHMKNTFCLLQ